MLNSIRLIQFWQQRSSALAFDFVTGQMQGPKRVLFNQWLNRSDSMTQQVAFWQEQLISLNASTAEVAPKPNTWQAITQATQAPRNKSLNNWQLPALSGAIAASIVTAAILLPFTQHAPLADYLAVLSDANGGALVTATSFGESNQLIIDWQNEDSIKKLNNTHNGNLQIWAKSKRDNQVRSITVLSRAQALNDYTLTLNEAQWRLITDAHSLIMTIEEDGGSAIGAPSEIILAQGPCIRLGARTL